MPNFVDQRSVKGFIMLVDVVLVYISFIAAFLLRYSEIPERNWSAFITVSPWILLISVFFLFVYEIQTVSRKSMWDMIRSICIAAIFISVITMSASFFLREFALPRSVVFLSCMIMILNLTAFKAILLHLRKIESKGNVLVIAGETDSDKVVRRVSNYYAARTVLFKVSSEDHFPEICDALQSPTTGRVFISSSVGEEMKAKIIDQAMQSNKIIFVVPSLYDLLLSKAAITSMDETMVMAVKPFGLTYEERFIKRIFDLAASAILGMLLIPLFLLIALFLKLESPHSPIFYKQKRMGQQNKEFTMYKFRSMIDNAEQETGPVMAALNDARVTKVGRVLRAARLDEIPQLLNVMKGEMSLVGPRPERKHFSAMISQEQHSYVYRSSVKPGMTGYAQVMGSYGTAIDDKLRFDLYYIRNYTFWLDIVIILRTFVVLVDNKKSKGKVERERADGTDQGQHAGIQQLQE